MAVYSDLTTNERIRYHELAVSAHRRLQRLNYQYQVALTAAERTALRNAAAPILAELSALTYDSVVGTVPD